MSSPDFPLSRTLMHYPGDYCEVDTPEHYRRTIKALLTAYFECSVAQRVGNPNRNGAIA
jgi:hypothetical protein